MTPQPIRPDAPPTTALYDVFSRKEWAALRANTPLTLTWSDIEALRGVGQPTGPSEVEAIHLPLSRLLNLHITAAQVLSSVQGAFMGRPADRPPYVIGLAGSVAVGKSTFARLLQAILSRWPTHPRVEVVATDAFLHPNRELLERGLMKRKGFPESYDQRRMTQFLVDIKTGADKLDLPVYSHEAYDILPSVTHRVDQPDVLIFEGLNVLQPPAPSSLALSDFFDFSIYLDAETTMIERWYVERFSKLKQTVFRKPESYFHHYENLSPTDTERVAREIWREINLVNLEENILPTRNRANLNFHKGKDHAVESIWLRRR